MRELLITSYLFVFRCFYVLFSTLPLQDTTVFWVTYGDNVKPISDQLKRTRREHKHVLIYDQKYVKDVEAWQVERSVQYSVTQCIILAYYLATSKYVFLDNYVSELGVSKVRRGAKRVQLWHAAGTLKEFALMTPQTYASTRSTIKSFKKTYLNYGDFIVPGEGGAESFGRAMSLPTERFIPLGMPRTDYWFQNNEGLKEQVKRTLDVKEERVVLYAPTYREYEWNVTDTLKQMQQLDGLGWKVLIKLHPTVQQNLSLDEVSGITIVDDTYTINEYLLITDVLITDYSSIPYESCLLAIPTFLYTPDYERYDETQGVIPNYPGLLPVTYSSSFEDVLDWINSDERLTESKEAMHVFQNIWYEEKSGHAVERIIRHYYI
ncbi:CDP-glycerol glycerophosphotransferase family protein [Exiguobacterium sp. s168]|uniref:CDP-glycerol glycerophosphotransferase family protein n=1 Tax=Exiguobacterium sp. s168 TaxID=2751194 RepID=UPI000645C2C3|nr:CDP-glycerol glycerophosphotransferase family protein [Exiguobacterium sp. s168]